jgi:hypothetical protein
MKLLIILFLTINIINASQKSFIINHSGLIDERAYKKINEIGLEVFNKLNKEIYIDIKGNNGIDLNLPRKTRIEMMQEKENTLKDFIKNKTNNEFIILIFALDQKYANIIYSNQALNKIVNKDDVLDGYVIPLLAAKDKNILMSKVSAASLNGYAQIADLLAQDKNIELTSSIGSSGKTASTIWRMFMYTIVLSGIILYFIIIMKERKLKNGNK